MSKAINLQIVYLHTIVSDIPSAEKTAYDSK